MPSPKKKVKKDKVITPQVEKDLRQLAYKVEMDKLKEKVQLLIDYVTAPAEMPESQKTELAEKLKGGSDGELHK